MFATKENAIYRKTLTKKYSESLIDTVGKKYSESLIDTVGSL